MVKQVTESIIPLGDLRDAVRGEAHTVGVPVSELNRHLLLTGTTGQGKTVTAIHAIGRIFRETDGPTIVIDPKGDWSDNILRHIYSQNNSLTDIQYFDMDAFLPAISFFDIRRDVDAGIPRYKAIQTINGHFLEILDVVLESDYSAVRSPDVIRYLIISLFDPEYGQNAYALETLVEAIYDLRANRSTPNVSAEWAEQLLDSISTGNQTTFDTILQGAVTRIEKFMGSGYLRPVFNHSPTNPQDAFTFDDVLNENTLLLFDISGVPKGGQRVLSNTILALLWRSLQRRHTRTSNPDQSKPLVTLFVDEVPHLGITSLLVDLLAMGRGYGLGVVPMMQYPAQLLERGEAAAHGEILNNCANVLAGQIPREEGLANALSSSEMSEAELNNRLGNLPQSKWLFHPGTPYGTRSIGTLQIDALELPAGHPESDSPIPHTVFEDKRTKIIDTTKEQYGVPYDPYTRESVITEDTLAEDSRLPADVIECLSVTDFQTTWPLVSEMPDPIRFDIDRNALICETCETPWPPTYDGYTQAMTCHGTESDLETYDVPPVELGLELSNPEIADAPVGLDGLCALQLIQNVHKNAYTLEEFDRVLDPLNDVLSRLGIENATLKDLQDAELITRTKIWKYAFYTPTPKGRTLLNESHTKDEVWGHGLGDLNESLLHKVLVEGLTRYVRTVYSDSNESPVRTVIPYFEPDEQVRDQYNLSRNTRFDVAGLDADRNIVLLGEAERANHDRGASAIDDYDAIAAVEPEHALWVAQSDKVAHEAIIQPLADPPDHESITDKSQRIPEFSSSTRVDDIRTIDTDGMTDVMTLNTIRSELSEGT